MWKEEASAGVKKVLQKVEGTPSCAFGREEEKSLSSTLGFSGVLLLV